MEKKKKVKRKKKETMAVRRRRQKPARLRTFLSHFPIFTSVVFTLGVTFVSLLSNDCLIMFFLSRLITFSEAIPFTATFQPRIFRLREFFFLFLFRSLRFLFFFFLSLSLFSLIPFLTLFPTYHRPISAELDFNDVGAVSSLVRARFGNPH